MSDALHTCPVCGYPGLDEPHTDITGEPTYAICPSCGTQFGADDLATTHAELREAWRKSGASWWSEVKPAPCDWSAEQQLAKAFGQEAG
ncbi:MAG: hypothetical protein ABI321_07295 [Polyangia bacterium]